MIEVTRIRDGEPLRFAVVVREGRSETHHEVTISAATCLELTKGACAPERGIEAAFRFLLDRESKESILARFDVSVIARYFPEFPRELPHYLEKY